MQSADLVPFTMTVLADLMRLKVDNIVLHLLELVLVGHVGGVVGVLGQTYTLGR